MKAPRSVVVIYDDGTSDVFNYDHFGELIVTVTHHFIETRHAGEVARVRTGRCNVEVKGTNIETTVNNDSRQGTRS